jgi:hypothetical protein
MSFTGIIRAYTPTDDGRVSLGIEESNPTDAAKIAVHDLVKDFNPTGGNQSYGARSTPCAVKPGFALYRVTVPGERTDLTVGATVNVTLDVYNLRRVKFYNGRWGAIPDLGYSLADIRVAGEHSAVSGGGASRDRKQ